MMIVFRIVAAAICRLVVSRRDETQISNLGIMG
jgi:hypothetical protein